MTEISMTDTTPTFMKDVAHSMVTMESITNTMVEAMMENTTKAMAITIMEVMDIDRHANERVMVITCEGNFLRTLWTIVNIRLKIQQTSAVNSLCLILRLMHGNYSAQVLPIPE